MKVRHLLITLLIASNFICLYRSVELLSYERMISFLIETNDHLPNPQYISILFLATCMANILFISATLMNSIINNESRRKSTRKFL